MTATNMCSNFSSFRCSPPDELHVRFHTSNGFGSASLLFIEKDSRHAWSLYGANIDGNHHLGSK